jgi:hypothetical protein
MTSIHENAEQAICPLSHDEMESVSGGGLQVPPYHGGPVHTPSCRRSGFPTGEPLPKPTGGPLL